jgi:gas vesicle protein
MKMAEQDNGFGTFLVGFIIGGITGAVVSLLYAPQSGERPAL